MIKNVREGNRVGLHSRLNRKKMGEHVLGTKQTWHCPHTAPPWDWKDKLQRSQLSSFPFWNILGAVWSGRVWGANGNDNGDGHNLLDNPHLANPILTTQDLGQKDWKTFNLLWWHNKGLFKRLWGRIWAYSSKDKAWWKSMLIAMVGCMQLMKGMIDNAVIPLEIQRQRQRQQEWQGWQCWDAYGEAWEGLGHRQSD